MARPIWKGMISFGLVSVPVSLYPAEQSHQLAFSMLDQRDFSPVGYKRYNKTTGKEVPWKDIVKGYEYEKDEYVVLSDEDFRRANVQQAKSVDIATFVDAGAIPPEYFETPYYLVPDGEVGQQAFAVIREAIRKEGMVALGRVVFTSREHVITLEARGKGLLGMTLRYPYEVRKEDEYFDDIEDEKIPKDMMELASHIVETKSGHFPSASAI